MANYHPFCWSWFIGSKIQKKPEKRRKIISLAEKNCYFESQFPGAKTELPESFTGPIIRLRLLKGETEHDDERLVGQRDLLFGAKRLDARKHRRRQQRLLAGISGQHHQRA